MTAVFFNAIDTEDVDRIVTEAINEAGKDVWEEEEKPHVIKVAGDWVLIQEGHNDGFILYSYCEYWSEDKADLEADKDGNITCLGRLTGEKLTEEQMEKARA